MCSRNSKQQLRMLDSILQTKTAHFTQCHYIYKYLNFIFFKYTLCYSVKQLISSDSKYLNKLLFSQCIFMCTNPGIMPKQLTLSYNIRVLQYLHIYTESIILLLHFT